MRIKIMVAIAIALAAIGLKTMDSLPMPGVPAADSPAGIPPEATWPRNAPRPASP